MPTQHRQLLALRRRPPLRRPALEDVPPLSLPLHRQLQCLPRHEQAILRELLREPQSRLLTLHHRLPRVGLAAPAPRSHIGLPPLTPYLLSAPPQPSRLRLLFPASHPGVGVALRRTVSIPRLRPLTQLLAELLRRWHVVISPRACVALDPSIPRRRRRHLHRRRLVRPRLCTRRRPTSVT